MSAGALDLAADEVLRILPVETPAAGATWSVEVPGESHWRLLSANMLFTAVGGVANRFPFLRLRSEFRELLTAPTTEGIGAGFSVTLNWLAGLGSTVGSVAGGNIATPWPGVPLEPGDTLDWLCNSLGGADTVDFITLVLAERWTGERPPERRRRPALVTPIDNLAILAS